MQKIDLTILQLMAEIEKLKLELAELKQARRTQKKREQIAEKLSCFYPRDQFVVSDESPVLFHVQVLEENMYSTTLSITQAERILATHELAEQVT
jgi:hypothetical protein